MMSIWDAPSDREMEYDEQPDYDEPEDEPTPEMGDAPAGDFCLITGHPCSRRQPQPGCGTGCPCVNCVRWGKEAKEAECPF